MLKDLYDLYAEFVIVGTGPVGATFARKIREKDSKAKIIMIDAGSQYSKLPGQNAKNFYLYNRDEDGLDLLSHMVKAQMIPVSKTPSNSYPEYLPPSSITYSSCNYGKNLSNPNQKPQYAMPSAASSFQVGGMGGHWTCCTPRPYATERISQELISKEEMDQLLEQSEKLYHTTQSAFKDSLRGQAVLKVVQEFFAEQSHKQLRDPHRPPGMLPLAVQKLPNKKTVHWTGVDTILGKDLIKQWAQSQFGQTNESNFTILAQTLAVKLHYQEDSTHQKSITSVEVKNLNTGKNQKIGGKFFIICGNAFYTPQLLYYSNIRPKALGKYLNQHSMMFCQVVLKNSIIESIEAEKRQNPNDSCSAASYQKFCDCKDPFPILDNDPIPNVWIPYSQKFPFHVQLHRDAFPYSTLPENTGIDYRVILDIRFFCKTQLNEKNHIQFQKEDAFGKVKYYDLYGLPQLSLHFERSERDSHLIDEGMKYMQDIANRLGGYLKGSQPQLLPRGQSLHFMGTTRIGNSSQTSTCDVNSVVWGTNNLYVGGNGNIPSDTACNPTLTSSALAIKAVNSIFAKKS